MAGYRTKLFKYDVMKTAFKEKRGFNNVFDRLGEVSIEVSEKERIMDLLAADARLFDFNAIAMETAEVVNDTRRALVLIKGVWDLAWMVESQIESWKLILWDDIQATILEEETKAFQKLVRGSDKATREWDVYRGVADVVKDFLISVPCVQDLKSPSMCDRHWKQLMEVTKMNIDVKDPKFSLGDLLALNLQNVVDDVGEVVDRAQKEDKMEQTLNKLAEA